MSNNISVVVDGIEAIGLHNGLYRIRFYTLDAKGAPSPTVELVAAVDTVVQIQKGLASIRIGSPSGP